MLGTKGRPGMFDNKIIPVEAHGLKVMSIGLLVNEKEPLVWRGPMIHSFIQQMLKDVNWGALFSALTDAGYKGAICIEVEDRAYEGSLEDRKRALRQSKRYLEQFLE